jgi:hypothetical protein
MNNFATAWGKCSDNLPLPALGGRFGPELLTNTNILTREFYHYRHIPPHPSQRGGVYRKEVRFACSAAKDREGEHERSPAFTSGFE